MLQHLTNCHGEWNLLFALLGSLPFVGAWIRVKMRSRLQVMSVSCGEEENEKT